MPVLYYIWQRYCIYYNEQTIVLLLLTLSCNWQKTYYAQLVFCINVSLLIPVLYIWQRKIQHILKTELTLTENIMHTLYSVSMTLDFCSTSNLKGCIYTQKIYCIHNNFNKRSTLFRKSKDLLFFLGNLTQDFFTNLSLKAKFSLLKFKNIFLHSVHTGAFVVCVYSLLCVKLILIFKYTSKQGVHFKCYYYIWILCIHVKQHYVIFCNKLLIFIQWYHLYHIMIWYRNLIYKEQKITFN